MPSLRSKSHHRPHFMANLGNGNETTTNGRNKGNLEGRKTRDGKAYQVREKNRIFRRNLKKTKKKQKQKSFY
jgi:hypothetical protein